MKYLRKYNENLKSQEILNDIEDICLELNDMNNFGRQIKVKVETEAQRDVYRVEINMSKIKFDEIKETLLRLKDYVLNYIHKTMSFTIYLGLRTYLNCGFSELGVYFCPDGSDVKIYYNRHIANNITDIVIFIK